MNSSSFFSVHAALLAACLLPAAGAALAATTTVQALDASGKALADAVIYAEPVAGQMPPRTPKLVDIEQKGRKFIPFVTVVQAGSSISFPNNDTVRHHVYSFSPAKVFELKLYSGVPSNPVVFDKAGTVAIGCNIHDQMAAYIHVVDTPYFGKTDASGAARIELPAGRYVLKAWHPGLGPNAGAAERPLTVGAGDGSADISLNVKPGPQAQ